MYCKYFGQNQDNYNHYLQPKGKVIYNKVTGRRLPNNNLGALYSIPQADFLPRILSRGGSEERFIVDVCNRGEHRSVELGKFSSAEILAI